MNRCLISFALAVLLAPTATVLAQPTQPEPTTSDLAQARRLYERGARAYEGQRFEEAQTLFEGSYQLSHRSELLYNIGVAADEARHEQRALEAFRSYLATSPNAERRTEVEVRIAAIEARIREAEAAAQAATVQEAPATTAVSTGAVVLSPEPTTPAADGESVTSQWWFWTVIGVGAAAIAGGVVAGYMIANPEPDMPLVQSNVPGVGVIWALRSN